MKPKSPLLAILVLAIAMTLILALKTATTNNQATTVTHTITITEKIIQTHTVRQPTYVIGVIDPADIEELKKAVGDAAKVVVMNATNPLDLVHSLSRAKSIGAQIDAVVLWWNVYTAYLIEQGLVKEGGDIQYKNATYGIAIQILPPLIICQDGKPPQTIDDLIAATKTGQISVNPNPLLAASIILGTGGEIWNGSLKPLASPQSIRALHILKQLLANASDYPLELRKYLDRQATCIVDGPWTLELTPNATYASVPLPTYAALVKAAFITTWAQPGIEQLIKEAAAKLGPAYPNPYKNDTLSQIAKKAQPIPVPGPRLADPIVTALREIIMRIKTENPEHIVKEIITKIK